MSTGNSTAAEEPRKFGTLDALRGVAAIAVMAFHYTGLLGRNVFPHGYLAVDFFFALSGFVLAFAYQGRLDRGWGTGSFLITRLIRLYPLYLAGLLLGAAFSALQSHFGRTHLSATATLLILLTSLFLLPAFGLPQQAHEATIYPFNRPSWSLFYEVLANILHALILRRRSARFLGAALALSTAALLFSCYRLGKLDFGLQRPELAYGVSRVMFSYLVGLVLLRIWRSGRVRVRCPPAITALLLLAALATPVPAPWVLTYDLLLTILVFPVLVLLGASSDPGRGLVRACEWLGRASYAIYVIHMPVFSFFAEALRRTTHGEPERLAPSAGILYMLLSVSFAVLLDRVYDLPAREFLRRKWKAILNGRQKQGA